MATQLLDVDPRTLHLPPSRLSGADPRALDTAPQTLLVVGGALYTAGAVIYALRRPDPVPRIFGYHEVFHVLVIAASACHFAAVVILVR